MIHEPIKGPDEGCSISRCDRIRAEKKIWCIWFAAKPVANVEELIEILNNFRNISTRIVVDEKDLCDMLAISGVELRVVYSSLEIDGILDIQDELSVVEGIKCGAFVLRGKRIVARLLYREKPQHPERQYKWAKERKSPLVIHSTKITDRLILSGIRSAAIEYCRRGLKFSDPDRIDEWSVAIWIEIVYPASGGDFRYLILDNPGFNESIGLPSLMNKSLDGKQKKVINTILQEEGLSI